MDDQELINAARDIQSKAHVPYSEYRVGAAVLTGDGTVFVGCNIEIANYSNSLHAEEVAIAEAVKRGHRDFVRIAVSSDRRDGVTPCGMCRQTLWEFCNADLPVVCDRGPDAEEHAVYRLGDLLPDAMTGETIG